MLDVATLPLLDHAVGSSLQIVLLGSPDLRQHGQPWTIARRQSRALLYYMAASAGSVSRSQLCFLFWPDIAEANARRNLTVLINHVRRALPQPDLLITYDDTVALERPAVWSDAVAFDQTVATATRERRLDLLDAAVDLYRGPFLHGFTLPGSPGFDEWIDYERQRWERRYLEALATLSEAYAELGDVRSAIACAQRYLATDGLAETIHQRLITLYSVLGDRAAALRQFERCAEVLADELDVEPLPETRTLYEAVRDGAPPVLERGPTTAQGRSAAAIWQLAPSRKAAPTTVLAPPRPGVARSARLPVPPNPLIGRRVDLDVAAALLDRSDVRLVTLCGPGGSGKTRLALQLAWDAHDSFAHGVLFVALAPLRDPALVSDAIAQACGLRQTGVTSRIDALHDYLHDKHLLLVLDNFEHLRAAAPLLAELLAGAPRLHLLVTSRAVLNLQGEHSVPVGPLPLPDPAQTMSMKSLAEQPAVALLLARTQAHSPSFQLTAANALELAMICVRLDGLPLALELIAAHLKLFSPRALLQRLDRHLTLHCHGPRDLPDRQQTLGATIDWSYELLDRSEQHLFESLAVFADGWTLEAVEAVCGRSDAAALGTSNQRLGSNVVTELPSLVDQHLVYQQSGDDGERRFALLETVRASAMERLEARGAAAVAAVRQRHAEFYLALAEAAEHELQGPQQAAWLDRLDVEQHNLRAALAWSQSVDGDGALAVQLVGALWRFWDMRGHIDEGRRSIAAVLSCGGHEPTAAYVKTLMSAGYFAAMQGDLLTACAQLEASIAIGREVGAQHSVSQALQLLGHVAIKQQNYQHATAYLEESLSIARMLDDATLIGAALNSFGNIAAFEADFVAAQRYYQAALTLRRRVGDTRGLAVTLNHLGESLRVQGDLTRAARFYEQSLQLWQQLDHSWGRALTLHNLGSIALEGMTDRPAALCFQDSFQLFRALGDMHGAALCLTGLAAVMIEEGVPEDAARLLGAAAALHARVHMRLDPADQRQAERVAAAVRSQLDQATFAAAWLDGQMVSPEQLIATATCAC